MRRDDAEQWIIYQNDNAQWEIERVWNVHVRPVFSTEHEAALFACMEARFYAATVEAPSSERLQIRVTSNLGLWHNCGPGQWWVATLHRENGDIGGFNCCSDSITGAKIKGLQSALLNPKLTEEAALELDWKWEKGDP